jgi:hypothetical protein
MFIVFFFFRLFIPNERPTSTSAITVVIPSMSTITASNSSGSLSSNHPRTSTPTRSNSPLESLNKLKRFLSTLYHFGSDISSEVGERVRALILALVVSFVISFDSDTCIVGFKSSENKAR